MTIKRTEDLKAFMLQKYSFLHPKKFEVVKIGSRVYLYYVDASNCLARSVVFKGCLPTTEGIPKLREVLEKNVDDAVRKWQAQYVNK